MENKEARLIKIKEEIYITTDEEVKEGDWFLFYRDKWHIMNELPNGNFRKEAYGKTVCKIIATTDTKLNLPQPSQAFIEKYCEAGGIDEVLVEYKEKYIEPPSSIHSNRGYFITQPKVNSNNEITISSIKDRWTREEYEKGLRLAFQAGAARGYCQRSVMANIGATCTEPDEEEWIKENLS